MKNFIFIVFLTIGGRAFGLSIAISPTEFIPKGYDVLEELQGDLNKDDQEDYVFIIKGTDEKAFVKDEYRGERDLNRRGIVIVFKNKNKYELVLENRDCFSSQNEDGGFYFPSIITSIEKGNLLISYGHGRYGGYWQYNFRHQNTDFQLIGFNSGEVRGPVPVVERFVSINLLTKKMYISVNTNRDAEGGDEKFKETKKKFILNKPIKLSKIMDFDDLNVEKLNRLGKKLILS